MLVCYTKEKSLEDEDGNMDMKVSGSGVLPGGEYESVKLSGAVKLAGDVTCTSFSSSGALQGQGINCLGKISISGSSKLGDLSAEELAVSGAFACGTVKCTELSVKGAVSVAGDITATESAVLQGAVSCKGLLSAERISIVFDSSTELVNIKGFSVSMAKESRLAKNARVTNGVDADEISLTHVSCPRVSGKRVTIGKGCKIDLVEYSETVDISPDAEVVKTEKI